MIDGLSVLHISDLHITDPHKSLDEVWNPVAPVVKDRRGAFDLVIVSGDLSQNAGRSEYVQKFLDDFYQGALATAPDHKFDLSKAGEDWSAHVFREHSLVVLGLNSCAENDKHWHGASFDPQTLASVGHYLGELRGPDF